MLASQKVQFASSGINNLLDLSGNGIHGVGGREGSFASPPPNLFLYQILSQFTKVSFRHFSCTSSFSISFPLFSEFAYFYWYTVVRTLYLRRVTPPGGKAPTQIATAVELLLGALAGGLAQIFTIPVSVIATRQQLASPSNLGSDGPPRGKVTTSGTPASNSTNPSTSITSKASEPLKKVAEKAMEDDSFLGVAKDILREDGVTGLWRGLKPSLVLTVNPAITYGVFERVKGIILAASKDGKMTPWKSFMVGAVSKTLATIVTFPYILSKIRLQAKNSQYTGAFDVLGKIAAEKGISGWYQVSDLNVEKGEENRPHLALCRDEVHQIRLLFSFLTYLLFRQPFFLISTRVCKLKSQRPFFLKLYSSTSVITLRSGLDSFSRRRIEDRDSTNDLLQMQIEKSGNYLLRAFSLIFRPIRKPFY